MARLFSTGFELQSVTDGVEWDTTTGSPTIDTTTKRSGAASLNCAPTAATAYITHRVGALSPASKLLFVRFYLYITTSTNALDTIFKMSCFGFGVASIRLNSDRTLELWSDLTTAQIGSDSSALSTGTWYCIEFSFDITNAAATVFEAKIDGTAFVSDTADLSVLTYSTMSCLFGAITTTTCNINIDDIAVNDDSGTAQTSYPGAGSIVHVHPNASGDNSDQNAGTYESIDEVTPNDDTDYIELDDNNDIADFNCESSATAGISGTINCIQVGVRHRPETAAAAGYKLRIKGQASGTVAEGSAKTHNDTTWKTNSDALPRIYSLTSYVNPQDSAAWETTDIDNMQIGIEVTDATPDFWVSTLWALVDFTPATGTAHTHTTADSISFADSPAKAGTRVSVDTITFADSLSKVATFIRTMSDSITFSDVAGYSYPEKTIKTLSDSFTFADIKSIVINKNNNDTLTLIDAGLTYYIPRDKPMIKIEQSSSTIKDVYQD